MDQRLKVEAWRKEEMPAKAASQDRREYLVRIAKFGEWQTRSDAGELGYADGDEAVCTRNFPTRLIFQRSLTARAPRL